MSEDWWSDIHFEMSTTPRRVFNQAHLYRQTGSSGIHSHEHKHTQLFVVFFSSSLRDTDDIKRRTFFFFFFTPSLPDLRVEIENEDAPLTESPNKAAP